MTKPTIQIHWILLFCLVSGNPGVWASADPDNPAGVSGETVRVLLVPRTATVLACEVAARIDEIRVDLGDSFDRGDMLVVLDSRLYRQQLDMSRADLIKAEKTLEVNKRLEKLGSVSELEIAIAAADVKRARAQASHKQIEVDKCMIRAPFAGRVIQRVADPFEVVKPGQPVLEIIDHIHLELQLHVPSAWLRWLKKDHPCRVHIDEVDKDYTGRVTSLGANVDPASQTLEIRVRLRGNLPELLAGMSGTATFIPSQSP